MMPEISEGNSAWPRCSMLVPELASVVMPGPSEVVMPEPAGGAA